MYMSFDLFQTWEDPNHETPDTKTKGDCDPLDVCEIGFRVSIQTMRHRTLKAKETVIHWTCVK